jgi:peptide/nickel transport system substrate-binding protein
LTRTIRQKMCAAIVGVTALALALAACSSSTTPSGSGSKPQQGGVATLALPPALYPNSLFPLASPAAIANSSYISIEDFQYLLWRPLYWFGNNGQPGINYPLSLAYAPVFSNGGKTVTITLKRGIHWSDGKLLTSRDVAFWMNMLLADRTDYFNYSPGYFPDNLVSESYPASTPYTFSLTFNKAYSHTWLLYNQLSEIIPVPQHAWDKTSDTSPVGNYDQTTKGAQAVWRFLSAQNAKQSTYASNPLWGVVDGPWRLTGYSGSGGTVTFTPNDTYFAGKPHLAKFEELPFTSDTAEYNALRAGLVDYGYVPTEDAQISIPGYKIVPWVQWGVNFFPVNYLNPTAGKIFSQVYIRQAFAHLVNQPSYIKSILQGYGYTGYGPVPAKPASPYSTSYEQADPYPYSVSAAVGILKAHGWTVNPGGASVCARPGSGSDECGAGVASGAQLSFKMLYASGSSSLSSMIAALQSSFSQAGIRLQLQSAPAGTVIATASLCTTSTPKDCGWDMADWAVNGFGWTYSPGYFPSGEALFIPSAVANDGDFDDPTAISMIKATTTNSSISTLYTYENYLAKVLPVIWMPSEYYQLSAIKTTLGGTQPQDPNVQIYPENWFFSG